MQKGDFENLTLTGQIELVQGMIDKKKDKKFGLIGSSMGGYLASLIAQTRESVQALFLMAPGFNFLNRWRKKLDISKTTDELIPVFHYRYNKEVRLNTYLFRDAETWESLPLDRKIPTFIVHGLHDETIDIEESRNFVRKKSFCSLKELDSDHGLLSCIDSIIEDSLGFFNQQKLL